MINLKNLLEAMRAETEKHYRNRTVLDSKYELLQCDKLDRAILQNLQEDFPNSIIRMANSDLIASGYINGLGGSVPAEWDGSIVDLNQRFNV